MTAPTPPLSPLVGRDRELGILRERLAASCAGRGSLVVISGEAGIGKTALADALRSEASNRDVLVLIGRSYDLSETPPYGPWLELFAQYRPTDTMPLCPTAFAQHMAAGAVASQAEIFLQVQDFFTALAQSHPLLVILDDFHWADPASLDLLRFLARSLATIPALIVLAYRADELTRRHALYELLPVLIREAHAERLDPQPIEEADMHVLVAARYQLLPGDATRLVRYLHRRSDGNPFFCGELLHTLEAERVLRRMVDGWILGDLTHVRVPALLRQVIDGRLARLDEEKQRLLAVAAVIGQEVPLMLWATVALVDEDALLHVVERGVEERLLEESLDGTRVRFTHALIREAVYEGMLATRRRRMHRSVGEALAAIVDADPDAVAYHFQQAGDDRAAEWLVQAGTRARLSYAFVTAAARYEAAIARMEANPTASSEWGWATYLLANSYYFTAPERAITILANVIDAAARQGDIVLEALARYQRGLIQWTNAHSLTSIDDMLAAMCVLEGVPATEIERIRHYLDPRYSLNDDRAGLARSLYVAGRLTEARTLAENLVRDVHDVHTYAYATGAETLGMIAAACGQPGEARRWLRQAHDGLRAVRMHASLVHLIVLETPFVHLSYEPDKPEAETALLHEAEETEALARDAGLTDYYTSVALPVRILHGAWSEAWSAAEVLDASSYSVRMYALPHRAFLAWHRGEREHLAACVAELLPAGPATVSGTVRFHHSMAMQRIAAAYALDTGDHTTATAWLEAHDRWLAWSGAVLGRSEGTALWAQYYWAAGDTARAYQHAERALAYATEPRQPLALLSTHRLLGALDTDAQCFDAAQTHFDAALALADACRAPYERALTLLALARSRAAIGATRDAFTLLKEVRAICTSLSAKPTLARADALTVQLSGAKVVMPAYPVGLSAREVDVLRLMAAGCTNREIADALSLSAGTINIHVTHILAKTNSTNRTEAASFAHRHGLA